MTQKLSKINKYITILSTHILLDVLSGAQAVNYGFIEIKLLDQSLLNKRSYFDFFKGFIEYYLEKEIVIHSVSIYDDNHKYYVDKKEEIQVESFIPPDFTGGYEDFVLASDAFDSASRETYRQPIKVDDDPGLEPDTNIELLNQFYDRQNEC